MIISFRFYIACTDITCDKRDCGSATLIYEDGMLWTSPFPSDFPPLTDCKITVSADDNKYIAVQFIDYKVRYCTQ